MTKSFSLILIFSFALFVFVSVAQNCNNPLLARYGLAGLANPQSGNGLPYCQDLQNGQTCCSAATVNNFQTLLNNLVSQLQSRAGARDSYLNELRNNYLVQYQNLSSSLQSYANDIPIISAQNIALGNNLTADSTVITEIANQLSAVNNDFVGAFRDYQSARVGCFQDLLQVQASAWCLACDPNYAIKGVRADGTIAFSNDLINSISQNCYGFLEAAERFNPLIRARQSFDRLQNLTQYMAAFRSNGTIPDIVLSRTLTSTTNATQRTVGIPAGCVDDNNCVWQANNLFPNGVLNQTIAANGAGVIGGADVTFGQLGVIRTAATTPANAANASSTAVANGTAAVVPAVANTTGPVLPVVVPVANSTGPANTTGPVLPVVAPVVAPVANSTGPANTTGPVLPVVVPVANSTGSANTTGPVLPVVAPVTNSTGPANTTGPVLPVVAAVANSTGPANTTRPVLPVVAATPGGANNTNGRLLQNAAQSLWNPNLGQTGLAYNIVADPAGVLPNLPTVTTSTANVAAPPAANINVNSVSGCILSVGIMAVASLVMTVML